MFFLFNVKSFFYFSRIELRQNISMKIKRKLFRPKLDPKFKDEILAQFNFQFRN